MAPATLLAPGRLRDQDEHEISLRFNRSAACTEGRFMSTSECLEWLADRRDAHGFRVGRIRFDQLDGWSFSPSSGNLVHRSGKFFSVEGIHVTNHPGVVQEWTQPIIVQLEIGILGIIVKEFDGVLHCLMQAKMEPGNSNIVQLSPTVQATRSNYTRIHQGKPTPYLDYFLPPRRGSVLTDSLQTEQGGWFLHKRNRNVVIEVADEVEVLPDYCWLTLGQIQQLMCIDNVVNMDARTVLSTIPFGPTGPHSPTGDGFAEALRRSHEPSAGALHTVTEAVSWLTEIKATTELVQQRIPLTEVDGWRRTDAEIRFDSGDHFSVVAVDVRAASREVSSWGQPLLAPTAPGVFALLTRRVGGVLHVLMQTRTAAGAMDRIEVAPTVHLTSNTYVGPDPSTWPRYLDYVLSADPLRVRFDTWLSEEGGRFFHAKNRYLIVEVDENFPAEEPGRYRWLTAYQLMVLVRAGNCVNVEARTLLACLETWIGR